MSTWFYKPLGDEMTADAPKDEIRAAFLAEFEASGRPVDMAVFTRSTSGELHCEVTVYFSPAAGEIAQGFDAKPCDLPMKQGLELLAGSESSWARLFV
jgi:hypothetical protein